MLTINEIKKAVLDIAKSYPIKKMSLFGSYADGSANENSDVDILIEFDVPNVSLFTLSNIKHDIMDKLHKEIDIIHGPLEDNAMIKVGKTISLYGE